MNRKFLIFLFILTMVLYVWLSTFFVEHVRNHVFLVQAYEHELGIEAHKVRYTGSLEELRSNTPPPNVIVVETIGFTLGGYCVWFLGNLVINRRNSSNKAVEATS
jgi:hypothetical protein